MFSFFISVFSLIVSFVSVGVLVYHSRPRIKLRILNQEQYIPQVNDHILRNFYIKDGIDGCAMINVEIENSSDKQGTIVDVFLTCNDETLHAETSYKKYPPSKYGFLLKDSCDVAYKTEDLIFKQPIIVEPFSYKIGYIRIPNFDMKVSKTIKATLEYRIAGSNKIHCVPVWLGQAAIGEGFEKSPSL